MKRLIKKLIPKSLFNALAPGYHFLQSVAANLCYGLPTRGLRVIGVTGTDGKTTTTTMIAQMLSSAGFKVASVTTISVNYGDGAGEKPNPTHMTTASVWQLMKMLRRVRKNRPDWVVLEVSSHALAQYRVRAVPFEVAVLTNLTHEHLDYHGTFEKYLAAKRKLFEQTRRHRRGLQAGVVNADDANASEFISSAKHPVTYGIDSGDIHATHVKLTSAGSRYVVKAGEQEYRLNCHLPGKFNVYNSLAALSVGWILGLSKQQIEDGIESVKGVAGRMMRVDAGQDFDVIIDYAVTPAALLNLLTTSRDLTRGRVMIVFGATGDRDKEKRPVMGKIASENADRIFLTDDETYTEDPAAIRHAVYKGIEDADGASKTLVLPDRGEAIRAAMNSARAGDIVLITGLGHQTDRNMGGARRPWSDEEQVKKALG